MPVSGICASNPLKISNKFITVANEKQRAFKTLNKDGWFAVRQKGSHITMHHPVKKGPVVVPDHGSNEVGKGLEIKIEKDAGLK